MGTTKEKTGQGEEEEESNHLESRTGHDGGGGDWSVRWWAPIQTTSWRGVDLFSFFLIYQVVTHSNNILEGSRPVLILPHLPGRSPTFSKIPGDLGVTKMEALVAIFWVRDRCK